MSRTPAQRLQEQRLIQLSAELEVQIARDAKPTMQPIVAILAIARREAFASLDKLIYIDPNDKDMVRELQHEVRRYEDLVEWIKDIIVKGREADSRLTAEERDEFYEMFNGPDYAAERQMAGASAGEDA